MEESITRVRYAPPELRYVATRIDRGFALSDVSNMESLGATKGEIGWGSGASDLDNLESIGGLNGEINW